MTRKNHSLRQQRPDEVSVGRFFVEQFGHLSPKDGAPPPLRLALGFPRPGLDAVQSRLDPQFRYPQSGNLFVWGPAAAHMKSSSAATWVQAGNQSSPVAPTGTAGLKAT